MLESKSARLICDGIGAVQGGRRKAADGTVQTVHGLFVADGAGSVRDPQYTFGVTGTPQGYAYAQAALTALAGYDLRGKVYPVGETVHLSRLDSGAAITPAALLAGEIDTVTSDSSTGAYAFEAVEGWDGQAVCWITVNAALLDALGAYLSCSLTAEMHESVQAGALTVALDVPNGDDGYTCLSCDGSGVTKDSDGNETDCPDCNGTGQRAAFDTEYPSIIITGTAPAGAAVYLDEYDDGMCMICGGCGKVTGDPEEEACGTCSGSGISTDNDGNEITCPDCGGTGTVTVTKAVTCPQCGGSGKAEETVQTDALTPWVMASAAANKSNGAFTLNFDGKYQWPSTETVPQSSVKRATGGVPFRKYLVWTPGTDGTLTAAITSVTNNKLCLAGDTLITLADGSQKRLDEVRKEDLLRAGDGTPTRAVLVRRGRWNDHHTLYRFADGTVVDEIHAHRFFNCEAGFWQLLERWNIGDHARREDGAEVALVAVERVEERKEMFGLWTESRDYWANGLLSGETGANQLLLADATAEQAADMAASLDELAILQLMGIKGGLLP